MMPLALPGYVMGYAYTVLAADADIHLSGFWPTWFSLVLSLYPYVYVASRIGIQTTGSSALEASHSLGVKGISFIWRVLWPLCRPFWTGGVVLVGMETLADFGTVSLFSYQTFSTAIYKAWYGFFSLTLAAQLAGFLLLLTASLLLLERTLTKTKRYTFSAKDKKVFRRDAPLARKTIAFSVCSLLVTLGFFLPVGKIMQFAFYALKEDGPHNILWQAAMHSIIIALLAGSLIAIAALFLCLAKRFFQGRLFILAHYAGRLGYAFPGAVLAIGLYIPWSFFDHQLADFILFFTGYDTGLLFTGSIFLLILALVIRFLSVGISQIEGGLSRISLNIDKAAMNLAAPPTKAMKKVHVPLLRKSLIAATVLSLIDCLKEMPLTLMTRPFGWDTLAVKIFEYTSEGEWIKASLPSLMLVFVGVAAVVVSSRWSQYD